MKKTLRALEICYVRCWSSFKGRETYLLVIHSNKPTNHMRIVNAGISVSSILDTEARTSGYGESSSSILSKSNSILVKKGGSEKNPEIQSIL